MGRVSRVADAAGNVADSRLAPPPHQTAHGRTRVFPYALCPSASIFRLVMSDGDIAIQKRRKSAVFTLKFLSGPLYGTDIPLPDDDVTFVVGNDVFDAATALSDRDAGAWPQAENTLYVPLPVRSPNFRLILSTPVASGDTNALPASDPVEATAQVLSPDGAYDQLITFNTPQKIGALWLALKPATAPWSESVDTYLRRTGDVPPDRVDTPSTALPVGKRWYRRRWFAALALLGALAVFAIPASHAVRGIVENRTQQQALSAFEKAGALVLSGRDECTYLLVKELPLERWSRMLRRQNIDMRRTVLSSIEQEAARASALLDQQQVPFWTVRMDDPAHPLVITSTDTARADIERGQAALMKAFPYARSVRFEHNSQDDVIDRALTALDVANVAFDVERYPQGAAVRISGALDDRQLQRIDETIQRFQSLWGDRIVNFSVALEETPTSGMVKREGGRVVRYQKHHIGIAST